MIGCFSPISSITVFQASLKHSSSTSDSGVSIKSSSSSSASVVSSDSCYILDCRLRHKLEKKPWICRLDNRSVPSNILSLSTVQAVRMSFATCSRSSLLSVSRPILNFSVKYCLTEAVHLHLSYEEPTPWEAVKHLSRVLWPLQPVQSNFHPLMTMTESDEPTTSSLCHKDFKSCSQAQDLHDELASSYGSQGRPGS